MDDEVEDDVGLPGRRRVLTNFSDEEEKELILEFLQINPVLYSKRLMGYTAMKDNLWSEQAKQMGRTPNELKTWYTKVCVRSWRNSRKRNLGKLLPASLQQNGKSHF